MNPACLDGRFRIIFSWSPKERKGFSFLGKVFINSSFSSLISKSENSGFKRASRFCELPFQSSITP